MRMHPTLSDKRQPLFTLAAMILLYVAQAAAQTPPVPTFKASPDTIQAGRTRVIKITAVPSTDLTDFELLLPPKDTGVIFEKINDAEFQLTDNKRTITAQVKVDLDADPQPLNLVLQKKKDGEVMATYTVTLTITEYRPRPIPRQPVPPDLKQGQQVDSKFQPLSYKATKDVYGRRVADNYYAVAVGLGNNTGFDLQITKLGFISNVPIDVIDVDGDGRPAFKNDRPVTHKEFLEIAAIDSSLVRSSIEKEQNFGKRALTMNLIGGVGTFTSGFLPFFKAIGPKANFASFTSILNGQLKEGFNLAVPDLTIRQLNRLDSNIVMDGDFTLMNNSERNTVIFVPRTALGIDKAERDNLQLVAQQLGRLVIVGRPIERYANREIVVRTGSSGQPSEEKRDSEADRANNLFPPTTSASPSPAPSLAVANIEPNVGLAAGKEEVVITGSNFTKESRVFFGDTEASAVAFISSTSLRAFTPARPPADTLEAVEVKVTNADGKAATAPATEKYTYYTELEVNGSNRESGSAAGGDHVKIFGRGFLQGAKVLFDGAELPESSVKVAGDGKAIEITTPAHAAGKARVVVINPNPYPDHEGKELVGGFTYNP